LYAAGPGSGYLLGVEFECIDAGWRRGQGKPCDRFEWRRTIRYRVDIANNRVVVLPETGWLSAGLGILADCSVYDRDTWRCRDRGSVQNVADGLYIRSSSGTLLNGYEEHGSTRLRDGVRFFVGAPPPDPTAWR
jgi:hypothetical protein